MSAFQVTALDPKDIKQSLRQALAGDGTFSDYNAEGSGLSTIIDLLVRNTHYIAYLANMLANESFIDTAQLRSTVVSHAKRLSYTPNSRSAATAVVDLRVIPFDKTNLNNSIVMDAGKIFIGSYDGKAVSFVNTDSHTLTKDGNDDYVATGIEIKQGQIVKHSFTYAIENDAVFEIPNKNIDTSTLRVRVQASAGDQTTETFNKVTDITTLDSTTAAYFLYENHNGKYQIEFGDDILGKALVDGNIVLIEYVNVDDFANGVSEFQLASSVNGYTNAVITTSINAYGGSERESIERIRHLAPKSYSSQNRAVTAGDYETLLMRDNVNLKSAKAWGGEDNVPANYGAVYIAAYDESGLPLDSSTLSTMENAVKNYSVAGIKPIVVNAEIVDIDVELGIKFSQSKTAKTFATVQADVASHVQEYSSKYLEAFDFNFNHAQLSSLIIGRESGVESLEINKKISKTIDLINGSTSYTITFNNDLSPGSLTSGTFTSISGASGSLTDLNGKVYFDNKVIGTIDYVTGTVKFTAHITDIATLKISVIPATQNIDSVNGDVLKINTINVSAI